MLHALLSKDLHLLSLCLCTPPRVPPQTRGYCFASCSSVRSPACRLPLMRHSDALGPLLPDMACLVLARLVLAYKNCRPKKMPDLQAKTTCLAGWHAAASGAAVTILIISKMPRLPFWASVNWLNQQRLPAKAHTHTYTLNGF